MMPRSLLGLMGLYVPCYQIHTHFNSNSGHPLGISLSSTIDLMLIILPVARSARVDLCALFPNYDAMVSLDQICMLQCTA